MSTSNHTTEKLIDILLVEDNICDAELTRYAFENAPITNQLHVVSDGKAALDYIYHRGRYTTATRPDLILLDMSLPEKDGHEIAHILHSDPVTRDIPIIGLTGDGAIGRFLAEETEAPTPCIAKPLTISSLMKAVKAMEQSWHDLNALSDQIHREKDELAS